MFILPLGESMKQARSLEKLYDIEAVYWNSPFSELYKRKIDDIVFAAIAHAGWRHRVNSVYKAGFKRQKQLRSPNSIIQCDQTV